MVHLVTAIVKPHTIDEVKDALRGLGVTGLTMTEVRGYGRQGGKTETFRGSEYQLDFVPKVKIEVAVPTSLVDDTIAAIADAARTDTIGDGKIWAIGLDRLMRIRTAEHGEEAL